ncbi:MAG: carbohydrate binding family 9 domain-containing protein [bacterium]
MRKESIKYFLSIVFCLQSHCYSILYAFNESKILEEENKLPYVQALILSEEQVEEMQIDGWLTEQVWQSAEVANGFRQREPHEGAPATEETVVRVLYDQSTLYIGVMARDRHSDKIIARILQRDKIMQANFDRKPIFSGDDAVAILLDPFHDHRNAVVFATNPNGAEFDALISDEGREFNIDWRAVWWVAARRIPEGWSAEIAIPFRSLRYPSNPDNQPWGFNIYRIIRRKNEEVLWSAWSRDNEGFARVSRAGHLYGMIDLPRQSFNLEIKPFALSGITREVEETASLDTNPRLDAGLDVKWEVRPGLLLDLTLNTDFAQVEVDDEQVNLTRFDLFFPEKRDFFLENAGIFEFGVRGFFEPPPFLLFFSRQIGISEDGVVPVVGGARLTGRIGKQTVGLLNVVTDRAFEEPRTNFAVARIKRDVGSNNYVGAMLTDRRSKDAWNHAMGLDWSIWPIKPLNIQGFVARTFTSGAGGNDNAYRVSVDYQTNQLGFTGQHLVIGPETNAEMGFITRNDIRRTVGFIRVTPRPRVLGLRLINFYWSGEYITRVNGEIQDWSTGTVVMFEWNSGENFGVFFSDGFTRLNEGFELTDHIEVPIGDYDLWQLGWFGSTSRNRTIVLGTQGSLQGFFDGQLFSLGSTLSLAFGSNLSLSLGYTHNAVDIPAGTFNADLGSLRLSYEFSTRLVANALLQYNSLDKTLSANVRLNFVHRPGSDLFIVFNEQRGSETSIWDLESRGLVVKLTYLKRL